MNSLVLLEVRPFVAVVNVLILSVVVSFDEFVVLSVDFSAVDEVLLVYSII